MKPARELLGQIVDLSVKQYGMGSTSYAKCYFCEATAEHIGKLRHFHNCVIAQAVDLLATPEVDK